MGTDSTLASSVRASIGVSAFLGISYLVLPRENIQRCQSPDYSRLFASMFTMEKKKKKKKTEMVCMCLAGVSSS